MTILLLLTKLKDTYGLAHGHQFRSGGGTFVPAKAQSWHMKQSYNKESYVGYADILVYGHFHHFTMIEDQILIGAQLLMVVLNGWANTR